MQLNFLLGIALWIGPYAFLVFRMGRLQQAYLRACRETYRIALPLVGEDGYVDFEAVALKLRLYREPQPDPDLEYLRRRLAHQTQLTFTYGFGGLALPVVFSYL
jgi:hypothetical protein